MSDFKLDRRQILAGAAFLGAGVVAAMSTGRLAFAAEGKVLKVQNDKDISILDPANRSGWWEENVMFAIFNSLCQYKAGDTWDWKLDIAEELDASDPTRIRFKLKPGIKWTGGYGEVSAEDVKFSFERIADPKGKSGYKDDWDALDHVEVIDKLNGVIHLKQAFPPLFKSTLPHGSGMIMCKAAVEKAGGAFTTEPPATSGPYKIGTWVPNQKLILVRNELWTGEQPYFDEIQLTPITDLKTAEIGYQSGDLDVTKVSLSSVPQLKQAAGADTTIEVLPSLHYMWMGLNVENPKFQDVRVRRAIQRAINVDEVIQAAYFGEGTVAHGIVPPPLPGYRAKNLHAFDPAESKKLLAEAGVKDLTFRIDLPGDTDRITMAQVIQAQLKAVGVTVEINVMDRGAYEDQFMESKGDAYKKTEAYIVEFSTAPDASWVTMWFTCDQVGSWNWQRLCDPAFDTLSKKATYETNDAVRTRDFEKLQDMLEESASCIFLTHGSNCIMSRSNLKNIHSANGQWLTFKDAIRV